MLRTRPWLLLIIVPIALQWPDLSGWLSANPLYLEAGLARDWRSNGVLPGQPGWIDGNAGATLQALGHLAAHDWTAGIVPWWNPFSGVGMPLAGEMQPAAFFLPFVFLLGLTDGVIYLKIVMQIIAGLSTWRLLRDLDLSRPASLSGALLFQLNGTFAWDADSSSLPVAFLPVILLGIERAAQAARLRAPGGWRLLSLGLAYSVLAGFPETTYINGIFAVCWTVLRAIQARGSRRAFAARICCGGVVALMVCAPVLLGFFSFLGQADPATRHFAHVSFHAGDFALLLFPYLYGPIFFHELYDIWFRMGGFVGLPVLCLALAAVAASLLAKPRHRGLRWLLAGWSAFAIAKSVALPGATEAWNLVPMIARSYFYRYADSSWEFCAIVLAAMALDDLRALETRLWRRAMAVAGIVAGLAAGAVLLAARPIMADVAADTGGRIWVGGALLWGILCTSAMIAAGLRRHARPGMLAGLLALDAAVQFSVPLLSGTRGGARDLDLGVVDFLRSHIGLNRFYTLGPFGANYGAYYRIADINHIYAPVPLAWHRYIRAHLDPLAADVTFNGAYPPPSPGQESRPEALRRRTGAYAAIGVKYVLTQTGNDPFAEPPESLRTPAGVLPVTLQPGEAMSGRFAAGDYDPGDIAFAGTVVATFAGHATGRLSVQLCADSTCVAGSAPLAGRADNSTLIIPLSQTLHLSAGQNLRFEITHEGGTTPVVLPIWRDPGGRLTGPIQAPSGHMPRLLVWPPAGDATPKLVFQGSYTHVYELPAAAPYAEAPGCLLIMNSRTEMHAHCTAPARLLRRELSFPGWQVRINGSRSRVETSDIFQAVALPAGDSTVRFSFSPPFVAWGYLAAFLGVIAVVGEGRCSFLKKRTKRLLVLRGVGIRENQT